MKSEYELLLLAVLGSPLQYRYRARLAHKAVPDVSPESIAKSQDLTPFEAQIRQRLSGFIKTFEDDELGRMQEHGGGLGLDYILLVCAHCPEVL